MVEISYNPDLYLLKIFAVANLIFHLIFLFPFLQNNSQQKHDNDEVSTRKFLTIYLTVIASGSILLWLAGISGIYSISFSLIALFCAGASFPVCLRLARAEKHVIEQPASGNFIQFCEEFSISKREAEVITEICSGKTNKAIADKLFITLQTVKDHTHRIYSKTGVKTRIQLANLVRERTGDNQLPGNQEITPQKTTLP